jgi:hypothetical protein
LQNINQGKVNILGTEYEVIIRSEKDDLKLKDSDGYCETYSKKLVVFDLYDRKNDLTLLENLEEYQEKVLKHEIIHAFLHESGLDSNSDWARNEEIVDWIALQFDKIKTAIYDIGNPSVNISLDGKKIAKATADYFQKNSTQAGGTIDKLIDIEPCTNTLLNLSKNLEQFNRKTEKDLKTNPFSNINGGTIQGNKNS